jgi:uncharacterized alkaline shock family protein YloU
MISINDRVVEKMAARAAAEIPDAGAAAPRVLGRSVPGAAALGVPEVSNAVREHVRDRVHELTSLTVTEVAISVTDLVTHLPGPPRVR